MEKDWEVCLPGTDGQFSVLSSCHPNVCAFEWVVFAEGVKNDRAVSVQ